MCIRDRYYTATTGQHELEEVDNMWASAVQYILHTRNTSPLKGLLGISWRRNRLSRSPVFLDRHLTVRAGANGTEPTTAQRLVPWRWVHNYSLNAYVHGSSTSEEAVSSPWPQKEESIPLDGKKRHKPINAPQYYNTLATYCCTAAVVPYTNTLLVHQ